MYNSINKSDWVPLGDDFISLLDACAQAQPLFIDVHNVRPVAWPATNPPQNELLPPFDTIQLGPGLGAANPARCQQGAPGWNISRYQPVVFSAPLQCPPFVTFLGRLRRNSTYLNATSRSRSVTIADAAFFESQTYNNLTAAQLATIQSLGSDLVDRTQLLSTLMMQRQGPSFNHSPRAHYAACRPAICTTTQVSERTTLMYFEEALATAGGLATSVIGLCGCVRV